MELLDVVDENGIPTGEVVERAIAHRDGIPHRTAHIWVISTDHRKVLLQKRSFHKDSFAGCLDTSSAGHIKAGDEPLPSAMRELQEELGITVKENELRLIGLFHNIYEVIFYGQNFRDNEVCYVYALFKDVKKEDLCLQKDELEDAGWYDLDETITRIRAKDPAYCVPIQGIVLVKNYLERI